MSNNYSIKTNCKQGLSNIKSKFIYVKKTTRFKLNLWFGYKD